MCQVPNPGSGHDIEVFHLCLRPCSDVQFACILYENRKAQNGLKYARPG